MEPRRRHVHEFLFLILCVGLLVCVHRVWLRVVGGWRGCSSCRCVFVRVGEERKRVRVFVYASEWSYVCVCVCVHACGWGEKESVRVCIHD